MTLTHDQKQALAAVFTWLKNPKSPLVIGGYAGTGKTTLVSLINQVIHQNNPKIRIAFATYTGKASQVLRDYLNQNKGLYKTDYCGTIHSLIYRPEVNTRGQIINWIKNAKIKFDLIIIDEASMVSNSIRKDLEAFNIPIIFIGDHGQLPPINDSGNLMQDFHVELTQIHRQARLSPILTLAESVRLGFDLVPYSTSHPALNIISSNDPDIQDILDQVVLQITQNDKPLILVGRNKTRINLNRQIRNSLGFFSDDPQVGEIVICLKNNYEHKQAPIFNGMIGQISHISSHQQHWYYADINFEQENVKYSGKISKYQFNQPATISEVRNLHFSQIGDRFDYGYAITVHKSQGSQANRVILFEENARVWMGPDYYKWLYTGITRAKEKLTIILPS